MLCFYKESNNQVNCIIRRVKNNVYLKTSKLCIAVEFKYFKLYLNYCIHKIYEIISGQYEVVLCNITKNENNDGLSARKNETRSRDIELLISILLYNLSWEKLSKTILKHHENMDQIEWDKCIKISK